LRGGVKKKKTINIAWSALNTSSIIKLIRYKKNIQVSCAQQICNNYILQLLFNVIHQEKEEIETILHSAETMSKFFIRKKVS